VARILLIDPIMADANPWAPPLLAAGHDVVVLWRKPDLKAQAGADFVICPDDLSTDWRQAIGRSLSRLRRPSRPAGKFRPMTPSYAPVLTCRRDSTARDLIREIGLEAMECDALDRYRNLADAGADLLIETDADGVIQFLGGSAATTLNLDSGQFVGSPVLDLVEKSNRASLSAGLSEVLETGHLAPIPVRIPIAGRQMESAVVRGISPFAAARRIHFAIQFTNRDRGIFRDHYHRHHRSGLFDRVAFIEIARDKLQASLHEDQPYQITLLHIDSLADIALGGPPMADAVLASVGAFLRAWSADGDSVGQFGAARFAILHPSQTDTDGLTRRLSGILSGFCDGDGAAAHRIMAAVMDLDNAGLADADTARALSFAIEQFEQTKDGTFKIQSLSESMEALIQDSVSRTVALKDRLASGAIGLSFQPIVDLGDRALHHFEALSRLSETGSTLEVVSFAEKIGLAEDFDLVVCRQVIDHLAREAAAGNDTRIAVNLSARSLQNQVFVTVLRRLMQTEAALRPRLLIEITETARIQDPDLLASVLHQLSADGHLICIDDFGAGETSFNHLRRYHADFVKIDGSYIAEVGHDARSARIVGAIAALCRDLGIRTVAEMIETDAQAQQARELGIDLGQGYLFGRPAPLQTNNSS